MEVCLTRHEVEHSDHDDHLCRDRSGLCRGIPVKMRFPVPVHEIRQEQAAGREDRRGLAVYERGLFWTYDPSIRMDLAVGGGGRLGYVCAVFVSDRAGELSCDGRSGLPSDAPAGICADTGDHGSNIVDVLDLQECVWSDRSGVPAAARSVVSAGGVQRISAGAYPGPAAVEYYEL